MLNTDKELKLYYSIAEVADMFGVNASLLRFWEKEFPHRKCIRNTIFCTVKW